MAASSVSGIDFKNAAALPGKCGVKNIPFKISPKVDCSKEITTISTMLNKQLFPLLLICIAVAVSTTTGASNTAAEDAILTCNMVYSSLEPCLGYVLGGELTVSPECCSGIKSILNAERTRADRERTCTCIKSVGSTSTAIPISRAAQLPGLCKANISFKISPDVDCSKTI
ncbi:hypothetical protein MTR67_036106 [Solanum verrucosum]|uniref:Non-specific lipid-transfer protein n=2 Tax=Solanum TaxID=4107 RepID=A0AAF0ZKL3_SOLVR|nr:non-specific lipid-transfer protein 1-like [Solanum verrucosum]WMV42721.1 hypothetical protein MTR67_036106 [Solanum verrucosum]